MKKFIKFGTNEFFNIDHIVNVIAYPYKSEDVWRIWLYSDDGNHSFISFDLSKEEALQRLDEIQEELNNCYN